MSNSQASPRTLTLSVLKYALVFGTAYTARLLPGIETLQDLKDVWFSSASTLNVTLVPLDTIVSNHTSEAAATSVSSLLNATATSADNVIPDIVVDVAWDAGSILGGYVLGYFEVILCSMTLGVFVFVRRVASRTPGRIDTCGRVALACLRQIVKWIWTAVKMVSRSLKLLCVHFLILL